MNDDFLVPPKSAKAIEIKALDWRHAFGVEDAWAPSVIDLFEKKLPKLFPNYTLMVRSDAEMAAIGDAEAYTSFNPPIIAVLDSVDLLPNLPSFIRRVCSSFAPGWGVLRTRLV
jgi:hypothetical protein